MSFGVAMWLLLLFAFCTSMRVGYYLLIHVFFGLCPLTCPSGRGFVYLAWFVLEVRDVGYTA
ncbi:hypothetical protein QBC37DRAFT_425005 [Rhypophila decipiens]|uniref:Uncharacterized protein n=1 Tax=Rhypophila decipiens TaxID=261697 RepID=A0AAN6Y4A1_9PEZI|nr:hypothetical protein QBC37DRAFT_425005 [Rhypophila decipiens]